MSWCFVLSQSANRIDELFFKGMRLRRDAAAAAAAAAAGTEYVWSKFLQNAEFNRTAVQSTFYSRFRFCLQNLLT
jgi:hypothetical protein